MKHRFVIFSFIILVCVVLAVVVNTIYGIDIVYTHLFYIPIILAGVWYPRYAIFLAAALGLIHIASDYSASGVLRIGPFLRFLVFMTVAYVTSRLTLKRDHLNSELQLLNDAMLDMISRINSNGIVEYVSPSVKTLLGYTADQMTGKDFFDFVHPDDVALAKEKFEVAMAAKTSFRMDYRCRGADGKYIWIESLANSVSGHQQGMNIYVFGSRDISIRKRAEEDLKHLSIHDSLTGLHNRFLFEEEVRRFNTGRFDPVGVVMCDLDGLKLVNDSLGHDVGDRQLIAVAKLLKEQFRTSDIVARIGGDEFAILLQGCSLEMMTDVCDRLKHGMMEEYIPGTKIPLMFSIGSATGNSKERSMEELLKEADINMYKEKTLNRQAFRELFDNIISRT